VKTYLVYDIVNQSIIHAGSHDNCVSFMNTYGVAWDGNVAYLGDIEWFHVVPMTFPIHCVPGAVGIATPLDSRSAVC
jgi:hypothetical protein